MFVAVNVSLRRDPHLPIGDGRMLGKGSNRSIGFISSEVMNHDSEVISLAHERR